MSPEDTPAGQPPFDHLEVAADLTDSEAALVTQWLEQQQTPPGAPQVNPTDDDLLFLRPTQP